MHTASPPTLQIRRDTPAWRLQVWISFALALGLCATGLAWLPGADLDRAFMVMGYGFCLTTTFALSKSVRDRDSRIAEAPMWRWVPWGGFALAVALTGWGLARMDISPTYKAYLLVSWLFLTSSAFTLAKTLRDAWEADQLDARRAAAAESPDRTTLREVA